MGVRLGIMHCLNQHQGYPLSRYCIVTFEASLLGVYACSPTADQGKLHISLGSCRSYFYLCTKSCQPLNSTALHRHRGLTFGQFCQVTIIDVLTIADYGFRLDSAGSLFRCTFSQHLRTSASSCSRRHHHPTRPRGRHRAWLRSVLLLLCYIILQAAGNPSAQEENSIPRSSYFKKREACNRLAADVLHGVLREGNVR